MCGVSVFDAEIPVLGFCAASGTGKTRLLKLLIPQLRDRGLRVGVIKHTHHRFEVDRPGKDSYELRKAGASETLIASGTRWALMADTDNPGDPSLRELLGRLDQDNLDLILVEGFRHEPISKIELQRKELSNPSIHTEDPHVIAVASDEQQSLPPHLTHLDLSNVVSIATFVIKKILRKHE
ncbi:MAG: molybdopterin-guanine dinucleotide biosynthesis protein B [Gammaproteobacteria bacterium]|nr:molybdopterin-guanine dinucleotide biosynthesis protein B [Gammaproteobacteria bacterium]